MLRVLVPRSDSDSFRAGINGTRNFSLWRMNTNESIACHLVAEFWLLKRAFATARKNNERWPALRPVT